MVSRVEGLCNRVDHELLLTVAVATCCGEPFEDLGHFEFKGIREPVRVFADVANPAVVD